MEENNKIPVITAEILSAAGVCENPLIYCSKNDKGTVIDLILWENYGDVDLIYTAIYYNFLEDKILERYLDFLLVQLKDICKDNSAPIYDIASKMLCCVNIEQKLNNWNLTKKDKELLQKATPKDLLKTVTIQAHDIALMMVSLVDMTYKQFEDKLKQNIVKIIKEYYGKEE